MIASPSKTEDLKIRALMLECLEIAVRTGNMKHAKTIGAASKQMKDRIETHDYSREDSWLQKEKGITHRITKN